MFFHQTILFLAGSAIGILGSTTGGAGLLTLPLLLFLGLPGHMAIATNRIGILVLEIASTIRFFKEKHVHVKHGLIFSIFAGAGALVGSNIVLAIEGKQLNVVIAVTLVVASGFILWKRPNHSAEERPVHIRWLPALIGTALLGVYGGLGIGGGFGSFMMMILLAQGYSFLKSAGLARLIGIAMSLVAALVFIFHGGVIDYPSALALGLGLAIGGWVGPGIAIKKGNEYVKALFIVVVVATAIKLIYSALQ